VAAVAFAAGVGGDDESDAGPATSPSGSATAGTGEPTGASDPTDDESLPRFEGPLPVYYVGDTPTGPRLYREFRAPTAEGGDPLAMAVRMALEVTPDDPDYRIPWPEGTTASATYDEPGELLTIDVANEGIDLHERPVWMDPQDARMALEQLMYTAQAAVQTRAPVRFLLDGEVSDQLLGRPVSEPLAEGDPMQVQGPVWIISPQDDTALDSLQVEGRGAFFEANVSWQVLQGGEVVREGYATAQECCTLSPYSFEVRDLPPGDYVLRVYDADMSDGEGPGEQQDTKRFTVAG
jgi:hypothetical protein